MSEQNDYYDYQRNILPGGLARSEPIVEEFQAVERAFALLPAPIIDEAGTRGFSETFPVPPADNDESPPTWGQVKDPKTPVARLPDRRTPEEGPPGFSAPLPVANAEQGDHAATYSQATDPSLPIARLPQRRTDGDAGFSAPLPVGLGSEYYHAAAIGQLDALGQDMQDAEARALHAAAEAGHSEQSALSSYSAAQAIYQAVAAAQAQTNALLGLAIGSTYVNADGELIMTYMADQVDDVSVSSDGFLTITY